MDVRVQEDAVERWHDPLEVQRVGVTGTIGGADFQAQSEARSLPRRVGAELEVARGGGGAGFGGGSARRQAPERSATLDAV